MAYHVNLKGEAGKCSAEKGRCPFGSEAEHFETELAARMAYEASMGGKTLEVHVKDVLAEHHRKQAAAARREAARREPQTVVPEPIYQYKRRPYPNRAAQDLAQDEFFIPEGGEIIPVNIYQVVNRDNDDEWVIENLEGRQVTISPSTRVEALIRTETDESKNVRQPLLVEQSVEERALNALPRPRSAFRDAAADTASHIGWAFGGEYDGSPAAATSFYARFFNERVKSFKANGVSLPYTRALKALEDAPVRSHTNNVRNIDTHAKDLVANVLNNVKPTRLSGDQKIAIEALWGEDNKPF